MHTTQSSSPQADPFARISAGAGLASVVLLIVGFIVLVGGETPLITDSVAKTQAYFSGGASTADWIGESIEVLSFLVLIPFIAAVTATIRRRGGETLGLTAFGSGLLYAGLSLSPGVAALGAAWYRGDHGFSGQTAVALNDLRDVTFFMSMGVLAVFMFATAAAVLRLDLAPRAFGWTAAVIGVLLLVSPAVQIGMMFFLLWTAAFSVALVRRMGAPSGSGSRVAAGSPATALAD
jgi:hypothetical protein